MNLFSDFEVIVFVRHVFAYGPSVHHESFSFGWEAAVFPSKEDELSQPVYERCPDDKTTPCNPSHS